MKERLFREIGHDFLILSELGKGAFSHVFECINTHTHKTVALKVIKKYKQVQKQIILSIQESQILEKLDHPHIVKFFSLFHTESFLILEIEYLKGGTLAELLSFRSLNEKECSSIMKSIFQAVSYLHKMQIIHRDLKPENIIFANKDLKSLKIVDFGLSSTIKPGEKLDDKIGTVIYMSPETIFHEKYTETADIWSCGLILYRILTNSHPIFTQGDTFEEYKQKLRHINWNFSNNVSALAKDLFLRCTNFNPIERYSANLALNHPWITGSNSKIPKTHLEEIRTQFDILKLKSILLSAFNLASIMHGNKAKTHVFSMTLNENFYESEHKPSQSLAMNANQKVVRPKIVRKKIKAYTLQTPRSAHASCKTFAGFCTSTNFNKKNLNIQLGPTHP